MQTNPKNNNARNRLKNSKRNAKQKWIRAFDMQDVVKVETAITDFGFNVNFSDDKGRSLLWFASCQYRNQSMVDMLLRHGADPNHNFCNVTEPGPLLQHLFHWRVYDTNIVRSLVEHKANVQEVSPTGSTVLHLLSSHLSKVGYKANKIMAEYLLQHGAYWCLWTRNICVRK